MNAALEARTRDLHWHDLDNWRAWTRLPLRSWSDGALRSYCFGVEILEAAVDPDHPTAAAIERVLAAHRVQIVPTPTLMHEELPERPRIGATTSRAL